jgi:hypothetical protein
MICFVNGIYTYKSKYDYSLFIRIERDKSCMVLFMSSKINAYQQDMA